MDTSQAFPGKFLKADDIAGRQPVVTIDRVEFEKVGDENKLVVYFVGKEKGLVLNKTNWTAICEIAGSKDSEDWVGVEIRLRTERATYNGKTAPAVRVDPDYRGKVKAQANVDREPGDEDPGF